MPVPRRATLAVHGSPDQCIGGDFTLTHDCPVHAQALDGALDVKDLDDESVTGDQPRVRCLAAGFGVERGLGKDKLDLVAGGRQ